MGSIRVVRGADLTSGPSSGGLTRKIVDVDERVAVSEGRDEPHTSSGWHHHGDHVTCVYVLQGKVHVEWGPGGRDKADVGPGEFYVIPANTIHREENPGSEEQVFVGFAVGSGPKVINVDAPEPG